MSGNDFMAWVLRSPFHGLLSGGMMLITVTGRKTGAKYTTPVGYYEADGVLWVLTSRNRTWWRNAQHGEAVDLLLKRKPVSARAEAVLDGSEVSRRLAQYLQHVPQSAKSLGIRMENKTPNIEDVERVAKDRLFVKIRPA